MMTVLRRMICWALVGGLVFEAGGFVGLWVCGFGFGGDKLRVVEARLVGAGGCL